MKQAFFRGLLTCLLGLLTASDTLPASGAQPNIVLIMADDMGYGDASCYGNPRFKTPHLDALAREGLRFTDFHSSGAVCSPTRAGLVTGRYQQRAGIPGVINADPKVNRHHGLKTTEYTFAKALKAVGYRTALFGKWHLGYDKKFNPTYHGFDEFRGFVSGNIDYQSHIDRMGYQDWWQNRSLKDEPGYATHLITRHAVDFIKRHRDKPFCLYVAHESPHSPFQGPNDPGFRVVGKVVGERRAPAEVKRAYREMIEEMDKGIGEIVATLRALDLGTNTFLFFLSDNGGARQAYNGPLRGNKGSLWEGGHRVPAIAWWPGRIRAGAKTDQTGISLDLMPTMLELAGIKPARKLDGSSLLPVLFGNGSLPDRTLFWSTGNQEAVRQGPWKLLVQGKDKRASLFNLEDDLGETEDVSGKNRERADKMRLALSQWREEVANDE